MKIAVRYHTRSGNTKKLAEAIAKAVGVEAFDLSVPLAENVDFLFLGSSVYAANVDASVKAFIADISVSVGKVVNFSTAALVSSTYKQVKQLVEQKGLTMAETEFHCRGSFKFMHKGRPNAEDCAAAAAFAKTLCEQTV